MQGRVRLLSVGALTQDTILRLDRLPAEQGKFIASDGVQIAAGMAASAACAARRLGAEVSLWASAGDDAIGDQLVAEIAREGVDCSKVRRVAGARSALSAILVDAAGERIIVPFYDPRTQADPDALPFQNLSGFEAVLADVRWPGASEIALRAARQAGVPAVLDADTAPKQVLERLLPCASHIVASEPAAKILCGGDAAPDQACRMLADRTEALVVITCGGKGTYWFDAETASVRHVAAPDITPVDTLSAGDVFHGAFAVGLADGMAVETTIRFASAAAAVKCQRFGGRLGAPTRDETIAMMDTGWTAHVVPPA
jgi:sulfofructose kinase